VGDRASHALGQTLGERLALEGTNWANLRFTTPLDLALQMAAPFLVDRGIAPAVDQVSATLIMRLLLDLPAASVMASEFWQRALASEERHVEVPFAVKVRAGDGPSRILDGVIDLAFRTAAGWELLDYKTDQLPPAALIQRYREQIHSYSTSWRTFTADPIHYAGLYSIRDATLSRSLRSQ
jgi:hypothetical protein